MLKKVRFIYNPVSGGSVMAEYLDRIVELYQSKGYEMTLYRLAFDGEPGDVIGDPSEELHHILIAGGDGTVNYVVNLMKEAGMDVPIAILPAGTANDFAAMLEMPADIMKACRTILSGRVANLDLGCVNGTYFVNVFSCGLFTDISQKTPTIIKNNFGKLAYYINGLGELPKFRKMELSVESEEGGFDGQALIFFVFNGRTAGNLPLAYLSEPDDGLLDVLIVHGDTTLDTVRTAAQYLNPLRKNRKYPAGMIHFQCRELTARSTRAEQTDIDGEAGPGFPLRITCQQGGLKIILP